MKSHQWVLSPRKWLSCKLAPRVLKSPSLSLALCSAACAPGSENSKLLITQYGEPDHTLVVWRWYGGKVRGAATERGNAVENKKGSFLIGQALAGLPSNDGQTFASGTLTISGRACQQAQSGVTDSSYTAAHSSTQLRTTGTSMAHNSIEIMASVADRFHTTDHDIGNQGALGNLWG